MRRRSCSVMVVMFLWVWGLSAMGQTFTLFPSAKRATKRNLMPSSFQAGVRFRMEAEPVKGAASPLLSVVSEGARRRTPNTFLDFLHSNQGGQKQGAGQPIPTGAPAPAPPSLRHRESKGIRWRGVLWQSFEFLAIEHSLRMAFDPPSRREMGGRFWGDYVNSLKTLHGWSDGNHFFVNYVGHPLQGAASGFILVQNDPKGRKQQFGRSRDYWVSRAKAFGWATVYSVYWELGFPLSEAAIGNLGPGGRPGLGAVDLVITETVGTAYLVAEDVLDQYIVRHLERKVCNPALTALTRSTFNVNRAFASLLRWKYPWYRDNRGGLKSCGN